MHVDWNAPKETSHRIDQDEYISPMAQKFEHSPPLGSTLGYPP